MKKIYIWAIGLMAAFSSTSCSDFLDAYSQDMVIPKSVTDLDEVLLGSVYVNSFVTIGGPSGQYTCGFFNVLDDDVSTAINSIDGKPTLGWRGSLSDIFGYYAWQYKVGRNYNNSHTFNDDATWNDLYYRINVANIILDEIQELPHESDEDAATFLRVQGEAHFLRAQFYFILANLYGNAYQPGTCEKDLCVPLKLTAKVEHDKDKDTQFQRATVKEIYDQIVADLKAAETFLTQSPQLPARRRYRASIEAVELLYSRVMLYMQNWAEAEKKADAVINTLDNRLAPIGSLNEGAFLTEDNVDIIFSQGPNYLATPQIFTGMLGDFCVTKELYDLYEENDLRKDVFFAKADAGDSIALGRKYIRSGSVRPRVSDVFTLRMSEAYLNKAEACAMQSGKEETALLLLDLLRKARIEGYTSQSYSGEELVQQIRTERRKELCFEGHRWFDLRRYAVCATYPYSKTILHNYNVAGDEGFLYSSYYLLEEKDLAYTFAIPETVIDFDTVPMEDNPREDRQPLSIQEEEQEDNE